MSERSTGVEAYESRLPLLFPIWGSHVKRIGLPRVLVGGGIMYATFPFFLLTHVSGTTYTLHLAIAPVLGLPEMKARNYLILDRYKVEGLPPADKFNCLFCGYANGTSTLLNARLDQLGEAEVHTSLMKKLASLSIALSYLPAAALTQSLAVDLIYNQVIAPALGMRKSRRDEAVAAVRDVDYAGRHGALVKSLLRFEKTFALRLSAALEQIESAWCPIKHFERMEHVVYPPHHRHFFEPSQIAELRKTLLEKGSVSAFRSELPPRKPRSSSRLRGLAELLQLGRR